MTIRYECEECGAGLKIKDELAGTKGKCPKCKTKFVVPQPSDDGAPPKKKKKKAKAASDKSADMAAWLENDFDGNEPGGGAAGDMPAVDLPDELTEDPTADLFDDFDTSQPMFVPDEPDPAEEKKVSKRKQRKERKKKDKEKRGSSAASTAGSAQALLNASAERKRLQANMPDMAPQQPEEEAQWKAMLRDLGPTVILPAIGFIILCCGTYWYLSKPDLKLPPLGEVSGTVTLNGNPLPNAKVTFEPIYANRGERIGSSSVGYTDANGYYELIYSLQNQIYGAVCDDGSGTNQLEHQVYIESDGSVAIPSIYNQQSQLTKTVKESNPPMDFKLTN